MSVLKIKRLFFPVWVQSWCHKGVICNCKINGIGESKRMGTITLSYLEKELNRIREKGKQVNVLGLVISNSNLCYCLLQNKIIKKIGIINIKKDSSSYNENYDSNKEKRKLAETFHSTHSAEKNLAYNYSREENLLNFNIKEILSILNFIKLQSDDNSINSPGSYIPNGVMINTSNAHNKKNTTTVAPEIKEENKKEKKTSEWIIGIEKVNEKYEKNKLKEKIISVLVYFMQSMYQCQILQFCPKEARKYFSNKCNIHLTNREITYKYIKQRISNFPSIEEKTNRSNSINYLFSDCYVISFYTHRYYMHELIKNNRKIFNHLEKEVKKNKNFNNILNALQKTQDANCKEDLKEVLKDKIKKIVETETYKLVDRYII